MQKDVRLIERVAGIAAIAFAILFVFGALMPNSPSNDTAANWLKTLSSSGDRATFIVAGYLWVVAALALLVLLASAWQRYPNREGLSGVCTRVAGLSTLVFVAMLMAGGLISAVIAGNKVFGGFPIPKDGDLIMQLTDTGTALVLMPGGLAAALGLAAVSTVIVREHGPRWLAILGFIAAICCVFGVVFIPMVALPIWILIAGIVLLRGTSENAEASPASIPA